MSIIQGSHKKIHTGSKNWFDLFFLMLLVFYILSGVSIVPFHGDEPAYLVLSEDYDRIVKDRDLGKVLFDPEGSDKQNLRLSTGSILSYSIGFVRDITDNDDPINRWLWGATWDVNIAEGNMPASQLLILARTCSAVMGAAGIVFFFLAVKKFFVSRLVTWAATLLFATHGGVLTNIRRAMQEGPKFLFLSLLIFIAAFLVGDFQTMKLRRGLYALLGAVSGLALAAKQDAAPVLVAVYLAIAVIPFWKKMSVQVIFSNIIYLGAATILAYAFLLLFMPIFWGWWESALVLIGVALILFQLPQVWTDRLAVFLAFLGFLLIVGGAVRSPDLWTEFLTPLKSMVAVREILLGGQMELSGVTSMALKPTGNRLAFFMQNLVSSDVMYMEAPSFDVPAMHEQIEVYENSFLQGRTGLLILDGLIAIAALIGGWSMLKKFDATSLFVFILLGATALFLLIMIPLPWQRYFLVMQIPYVIFAGVGIRQFWNWAEMKMNRPVS